MEKINHFSWLHSKIQYGIYKTTSQGEALCYNCVEFEYDYFLDNFGLH